MPTENMDQGRLSVFSLHSVASSTFSEEPHVATEVTIASSRLFFSFLLKITKKYQSHLKSYLGQVIWYHPR